MAFARAAATKSRGFSTLISTAVEKCPCWPVDRGGVGTLAQGLGRRNRARRNGGPAGPGAPAVRVDTIGGVWLGLKVPVARMTGRNRP